ASISKLVTAMVVLDRETDLSRTETISRQDAHRSSRSRFRVGSKLTLKGLLYAALMSSDNRAARALARATSGTIEAFTREMNRKVRQMGLKQTVFVEPTGLDSRNVSTAHETAKILHHALTYDLIEQITTEKRHTVQLLNRKNHRCNLSNTNRLLWSRFNVLSGKTGYIRDSDYCLTTLVKNRNGERLTLVVLGVPGDRLRFKEARRLLDWGFRNIS
ncbi:MAG: serine hydrolase, partial [candidate division Zixibacteria bacterium]|nr:serine hydrolase [candidate division Zixibacteria bacterium]